VGTGNQGPSAARYGSLCSPSCSARDDKQKRADEASAPPWFLLLQTKIPTSRAKSAREMGHPERRGALAISYERRWVRVGV